MPWIQVSFVIEQDRVPDVEAALEDAGALALTLADAADVPQLEPAPGATPLWPLVRLTCLFPDEPEQVASAQILARTLCARSSGEPRTERLQDQVWERAWLDDFAPTRFGQRLWICPRGQPAGDPRAVVVELDPGLAFGTGHHPTTALCLSWLDGLDLEGKTVIDYGCGSGILGIAALRLGATRAIAVDHDPQALEATGANAAQNRVAERLLVCAPEAVPDEAADLVLANILAGALAALAPKLASLVRPAGCIALSGILQDQAAPTQAVYAPWFRMDKPRTREEWVLLSGRRLADHCD